MSRINHFKSKISLIDYILSRPNLGFKISDRSKKNSIVMFREIKDQNNNNMKVDTIIISRFSNGQDEYDQYFKSDSNWSKNSYSVVDFIHEYVLGNLPSEKPDFGKIFGILDQYIKSDKYVSPDETTFDLKTNLKFEKIDNSNIRDLVKQPTQETFDYLKSRNITQETYFDPIFQSTYGNFVYEHQSESKIICYNNPIFLYKNEQNKLQTFQKIVETKTDGKLSREKLFLKGSDKSSSLYKSEKSQKTNLIVVAEAPEKCMAHYQLSKEQFQKEEKNPYYLATGGTPADEQLKHMTKIIKEYKYPVVLGFDNDKAGELYTLKTLANIISPNNNVSFQTVNDTIHIGFSLNSEGLESKKEFELFEKTKAELFKEFEKIPYQERITDSKGQIIYFSKTDDNTKKLIDILSQNIKKEMGIEIVKHTSITKDWVDDLERKVTLKRDVHEHPPVPLNKNSISL